MMTMIMMIMMPAALRAVIPRSFWPSLRPASCEPARQLVVLRHPCLATDVRGRGMLPEGRRGMLIFLSFRGGIARQWWCSGIRVWPLACARASVVVLRHPCLATGVRILCGLMCPSFCPKTEQQDGSSACAASSGGLVRCWLCQRLAYDLSNDR